MVCLHFCLQPCVPDAALGLGTQEPGWFNRGSGSYPFPCVTSPFLLHVWASWKRCCCWEAALSASHTPCPRAPVLTSSPMQTCHICHRADDTSHSCVVALLLRVCRRLSHLTEAGKHNGDLLFSLTRSPVSSTTLSWNHSSRCVSALNFPTQPC